MFRSRLVQVARRSIVSRAPTRITPLASTFAVRSPISSVRFYSDVPELSRDLIKERILEIFEGFDKVPQDKEIEETANIQKDLGLDSLDLVDIIMAIEEEFSIEIPEKDIPGLKTVGDTIAYIEKTPDAA